MADRLGPSVAVRITEVSLIRRAVIERFHCIQVHIIIIPNHDSCIHFAHVIEMIDEILSKVDDTTFGESIATYVL